ncbi:hypothetical protein COT97_00130 [Candidatus Falkowbacteria bacterium CG10_big_fil_rev_8_21_14_0_10_39_11]|uniref:DUF3784 domain-containing protein n=1 Tax=Candidatus Falkowbacteria bacterium CG10_big_fil_rev_8_21_14_0_10_39_11 TaxID=1974565 RepID=A0A2H0V6F7_9BACT|nr:MAG: hypothetical protein COT97_00130 [Candidatus Falkowbacteria bacterium CG10_big_fil_rev_8_21_14_0_10_39_11]
MIGRVMLGLIFIGVGFVCVWKTDIPFGLIGYIDFAERWLMGGSRVFYKAVGLFLVFLGALIVANLQQKFLDATLGSLLF